MTPIDDGKLFDVREIPCASKHAHIFDRWSLLTVGDYFVLRNGHDPLPLKRHFELELGDDAFGWEYLVRKQEFVDIKITKLREARPSPSVGGFHCGDED